MNIKYILTAYSPDTDDLLWSVPISSLCYSILFETKDSKYADSIFLAATQGMELFIERMEGET
jgi:hypothetical protein